VRTLDVHVSEVPPALGYPSNSYFSTGEIVALLPIILVKRPAERDLPPSTIVLPSVAAACQHLLGILTWGVE